MKDINKIIDSLSPGEQNVMYNALQKKLNRGPEYTISYDKSGYYVKCDSPQLTAFRFEEEKYAELAYHSYTGVQFVCNSAFHIVKGIYRCKRMIFGNRRMFIPFENDSYIATFIIPKGAVYTINSCGEIVSNKIMYTGRYLKL